MAARPALDFRPVSLEQLRTKLAALQRGEEASGRVANGGEQLRVDKVGVTS